MGTTRQQKLGERMRRETSAELTRLLSKQSVHLPWDQRSRGADIERPTTRPQPTKRD